jgi:phosphoglucosamine mutase
MKLFGTDGLRGKAGEFPLDSPTVHLLGRQLGNRLGSADGRRVVVGGDTRQSTPDIVAHLCAGLSEAGCRVAAAGVIPTPGVAELVLELKAAAGVSVSASHNPYEDNGIKIFGPDGRKWPDEEEAFLEERLLASRGHPARDLAAHAGPPSADPSLAEAYIARLTRGLERALEGCAVLIDTGHGAAFRIGPEAFRRLGARTQVLADRPDGRNINAACGALHPEGMAEATRRSGAAMGVAFDGDADRAIFSDETGRILDGDDVLWIIAQDWKRKGRLPAGGVVGTVMSNFGLEAALARERIAFRRAAVGDRNVARAMEESGAVLGGETSGHVLLAPFSPAGDGIRTALLVASIASARGEPLSKLATLEKMPQRLVNVRVARRVPLEDVEGLSRAADRAREELAGRGRVFLRYSGTEPLLRILVEGPEQEEVERIAGELEEAARREIA